MKYKLLFVLLLALTLVQCKTENKTDDTNNEVVVEQTAETFELPQAPEGVMHTFKALPYAYDALEPYIDAKTMEIHFSKHHVGYYKKFLKAIEGKDLGQTSMEEIFNNITKYDSALRNSAGGYWNHTFFWSVMSPDGSEPSAALMEAINRDFGSMENFKKEFNAAAGSRFGSGWAWVVVKDGKLKICSSANQDNPLMSDSECSGTPILTLDVWEHAYYLNYQNRRPEYISAFWNVVNWDQVSKYYEDAVK